MLKPFSLNTLVFALSLIWMWPSWAGDDTTVLMTQSSTMDQLTRKQSTATTTSKFASDFSTFSGSQENAEALIMGLRNGTSITLVGENAGATITPPTKPMGYGNTYISLSLAKAQLAQYGITEPTPQQINTALMGGTLTTPSVAADGKVLTKTVTLDGILTQRAAGLGWGQIAKANGFKLGQVISDMKATNKRIAAEHTHLSKAVTDTAAKHENTHKTTYKSTHSSIKSAAEWHPEKYKYSRSDRGITTALSGGGVVYGERQQKFSTNASGLNRQAASSASYTQRVNIVTATGESAVHGNSLNAAGRSKGPK